MSITAYYILKNRHVDFAKRAFTIALIFSTVMSLAQLAAGHKSAEIVAEYQPAKLAAFEGIYKTEERSRLYLFGWTNDETETVRGLSIPGMLSFLVHFDFTQAVAGFDTLGPEGGVLPPEDRPPTMIPFQMYHLMIACGMYFIGITLFSSFLLWRGKLFEQRWLMKIFVVSVILPYIANQAGWIAAEVGRQPWIVYGLLRTTDGVSKSVAASNVVASLVMFTFIYILLLAMFLYLLDKKIKHGPDSPEEAIVHLGPAKDRLKELIQEHGPMHKHLAAPEEENDDREERR